MRVTKNWSLFISFFLALALSVSGSLWADPTFVNAVDPDLPDKAQGVPKGGALSISEFELDGGGIVTLELERFSVFAADAELTVVSDNGTTTMSPPSDAYFRGWSDHDPESIVMLAVSENGSVRGIITGANGSAWLLERSSGKANGLQNRKVDLEAELSGRTFSCGVANLPPTAASAEAGAPEPAGIATNVQRTAHMIVDTDFEYWQVFGNANDAFQHMGDLFAFASSVYEREIDTNLMIDHARLFADNSDPYSAVTTGCGAPPDGTLQELRAEWQGSPIPRTLTHLLSGKPGGGCAWVGVLCQSGGNGYGTSMGIGSAFNIDNPSVIYESYVVAHEIGHNFDSPHSHNYCGEAGNPDPIDKCVVSGGVGGTADSCTAADPDLPGLGSLDGGSAADGPGTIMSYCGTNAITYTFGKWHPYGIAAYRQADRMYAHAAASAGCMTLEYEGSDLQVFKDCKPDDPALVGDTGICTIVVENHGPDIALGVVTEDLFLSNGTFDFGAITATKGDVLMPADTCSSSPNPQDQSGDVVCDLGEIGFGHSVTIKIPVTADSPQNVNDRVSVVSDSPDPDVTNNMAEDTLTFVEDADLSVSKLCEPDDGLLTGVDGSCTIIVQNFGPSDATNVHVVDTHVSNQPFTIDGVIPGAQCGIAGHIVDCTFNTIAAGDSETIVVIIQEDEPMDINDTVNVSSDTADSDFSNNTATDGLHIYEDADLRVSKLCKPDGDLLAGVTGTCEIIVTNLGPSTAEFVTVVDTHTSNLPFTIDGVSTTGGVCGVAGDVVNCSIISIAVGASETIVVSIAEDDPMDINDTVSVSSDIFDSDASNNIATDGLHIVGLANLSITKSDAPDPVIAGENLTYTLEVSNTGPSTAVNVVVEDAIPAGTSMVSASSTQGTCDSGVPGDPAQPTVCTLGDILSGAGATVTIVVQVLPDTTGVLHNGASVSSDTQDNDNSENQATADTTIDVVTDLVLEKSDDQDPVTAGSELKYLLFLTNHGPSTATGVVLVDSLPAQTSLVKIKVLGGADDCLHSAANPDVVTCTVGNMNPGEEFVVVITVLVDPSVPDGTTITNNADVSETSGLGTSASEDTLVNAEADLWIDKTGYFITENPSKTIRYVMTVHNDSGCSGDDPQVCGNGGPSDAQDVVVFDQLPSTNKKLRVSFVSEDCLYDWDSHTVTCTMQTPLAAGDSVFFEIEAQPKGRLRAITNTASVSSSTTDPDGGNNSDDMLIIVGGGGQK